MLKRSGVINLPYVKHERLHYAYFKAAIALIGILGYLTSIEGDNRSAKNLQTVLLFTVFKNIDIIQKEISGVIPL